MEDLQLEWKKFDELTTYELYAIWKLRQRVFIVEHHYVFEDADGLDTKCIHISGYLKKKLIAYARIVPPGLSATHQTTITRIVVHPDYRKQGYGRQLIEECIKRGKQRFKTAIRISNQEYLRDFYEQFGFESTGEFYKEAGTNHMEMIKI